jgi:hypothetical protein
MKAKLIVLCAVVLLAAQTITSAQKTEVSVRKGKVIAETQAASIDVEAGRKAILSPDKNPIVAVDNPLVDDAMEIYKWIEAEKQAQRDQIDSTNILIYELENEHRFKLAALQERPNSKSEPSKVCQIMTAGEVHKGAMFYDLQGNLLSYDWEQINSSRSDFFVRFRKAVEPGEKFRYIAVAEMSDSGQLWKDGPLWHLRGGGSAANCLNYYRVVLPSSAIFVDSSRPVITTDTIDGKLAVTCRVLGGPADNSIHIAFLWPDKDGTALADLPSQYRGLRDLSEDKIVQEGRRRTAEILTGGTYTGQKTPLETLLSLYSAAVHEDSAQFLELIAPDLREIASGQIDQMLSMASLIAGYEFLGTPEWPDEPDNGYKHLVYLCREGSLLCEATIIMVCQDGKWYLEGSEYGRKTTESDENTETQILGGVKISKTKPDLNVATYENLKPGQFMRKWLFLGPIDVPWEGEGYFPDEETSNKFFDTKSLDVERFEPKVRIAENDYEWSYLYSEYGVVDLTPVFDKWFVVAYAWAQIDMPEQTDAVLGIGSDDCIKVWLNGKLVHEHRGGRGVIADSDRALVTFKKGKNQLVLKILNYGGPWGFACRLLEAR